MELTYVASGCRASPAPLHPSLLLPHPSVLPYFHLSFQLSFFLYLTFPPFSSFLPLSPSSSVLPILPVPFHLLSCFCLPSFLSLFSSSQCWPIPCAFGPGGRTGPRPQDRDGGEMAGEERWREGEKGDQEGTGLLGNSPHTHTHTPPNLQELSAGVWALPWTAPPF